MNGQEALSLLRRFKAAHDPFSNSRWLMGEFSPVIGILGCIMNRIRDEFSMCDSITSQLVRHYLPGFTTVIFKQPLEKTLLQPLHNSLD